MNAQALAVALGTGIACTIVLAWVEFLATFVMFGWVSGEFGGYRVGGRSPARWAIPAWAVVSITLITLDVVAVGSAYLAFSG